MRQADRGRCAVGLCSTARRNFFHTYGVSVHGRLSSRCFSSSQSSLNGPSCASALITNLRPVTAFSSEIVRCKESSGRRTNDSIFFSPDDSAATQPSNSGATTSTPLPCDRASERESFALTPSRVRHIQEQLAARGELKSLVTSANGTRVGMTTLRDIRSHPTDIARPIKEEKS